MSRRLSLIVAIAACHRGGHVESCADSLAGVWSSDRDRWVMIDNGATLEAYPMFDDAIAGGDLLLAGSAAEGPRGSIAPPGDIVIAPRVIDLHRDGQLAGRVSRRTMRRADVCDARVTVRVTACHDDAMELELGAQSAPSGFAPCTWQAQAPPHSEHWHRD